MYTTEDITYLSIQEPLLARPVCAGKSCSPPPDTITTSRFHIHTFDLTEREATEQTAGQNEGRECLLSLSLSNHEHNRKLRVVNGSPCAESGLSLSLLLRCELRLLGKLLDSLHGSCTRTRRERTML